ncbi:AI-2E family transporter [Flavicella sediminum]|uniref:AI-2E family transporter n=1 Tax=Flavicella sediminum TaxID=2585141 RepID=UPI00111D447F|nr:AI-2E family transporter [Flavicella sediminum]
MNSKTLANGIIRALLIITGSLAALYFLFLIKSVLIYVAIAAVFALIARPIIRFLKRKLKLPNTIAVIFTMSLFILSLVGLTSMFVPLILKQGENLSLLNTAEFKHDIEVLFQQVNLYFLDKGIDLFDQFKNLDLMGNFKNIPNLFNTILGGIGSLSMGLFSVLFITFFFMKDTQLMHNGMFTLIPDSKAKRMEKSFETIKELLSRYFIGLVFQITILFVIYTTVLLIFGIENALVIAFLCAILNLIPYIGPLIGGFLMLVLTMTENIGLNFQTEIVPTTLYVMTGYIIAQLIDNFLSQPIIFSKSVKSHPLEIFLVIIIGGILFGVMGMVVAVPTYTAIKVILKEFLSDNKVVKSLTKDL